MTELATETLQGTLHIFVAFDWGEEIDLEQAGRLAAGELVTLARRPRTPSSVAYRPTPWRFRLAPVSLDLTELGHVEAPAEATVFDFGAVSVGLHVPLMLSPSQMTHLAGSLSESAPIVQAAKKAVRALYERLLPAMKQPEVSELSEEYFVFHLPPTATTSDLLKDPGKLLNERAAWTAGVVRLEDEPLSADEVHEALRLRISYSPSDLFVLEWSAALLVDHECNETLQMVEYANLQLLEYRHIDNRLDDRLAGAYKLIHPLTRLVVALLADAWPATAPLGELRIEVHDVFERTGNVLKLVGDQYLARCYQLLATRFHLDQWERNIERALEVVQGAYQVVADQSAMVRTEVLEIIVIILIAFEIVMAFFRH